MNDIHEGLFRKPLPDISGCVNLLQSLFIRKVALLPSRSANIVRNIPGAKMISESFLKTFLDMGADDIRLLPKCGAKSQNDIYNFIGELREQAFLFAQQNGQESKQVTASDSTRRDIQFLEPIISESMKSLSNRGRHVMESLFINCGRDVRRFYETISSLDFSISSIEHVGKKTIPKLEAYKARVIQLCQSDANPEDIDQILFNLNSKNPLFPRGIKGPVPEHLELFEAEFWKNIDHLSSRSKRILSTLFYNSGGSISSLYDAITDPDFSVADLYGCGERSIQEIEAFLLFFWKKIEDAAVDNVEEDIRQYSLRLSLTDIGIRDIDVEDIITSIENNGYCPYFRAIHSFILGLPTEQKMILTSCVRVYEDHDLVDKKVLSQSLGYSVERVRQLRRTTLDKLEGFAKKLMSVSPHPCPYDCHQPHIEKIINQLEDTTFSESFVLWMISVLFDEYIIIGDVIHVLTHIKKQEYDLALFPSRLAAEYPIMDLIHSVNTLWSQKRVDEQTYCLKEVIETPLLVKQTGKRKKLFQSLTEEDLSEVEFWCELLFPNYFHLDIIEGCFTFSANSYKTLSDIAYDVIKLNGHPMTAFELLAAVSEAYPERSFRLASVIQGARMHPEIGTIGRSGTYTLREWSEGEYRDGTIREFVDEYLDSLDVPLASIDDIETYVHQYRPTTDGISIQNNLIQSSSHKYRIYINDGKRFVGYTGKTYPIEYLPFDEAVSGKRSLEYSMRLLAQFINENQRFPQQTSSATTEEKRLSRFVGVRRAYYKNGQLSLKDKQDWELFEQQYGRFDLPKGRK